ncbi:hypothetical protein HBF26_17140 [Luteibacter jiangsuensis]|uniref:Uncharacterized protein n=1 Tax=Luteibacter jiangsuensis TaxID=637577 RepID=A0ABX0Q7T5_9GAMM|nr:hypothetical protein [Luteibacter jiangsuensis]NID06623.1 hypothetical protein [Luteibacter jiangsuensis]
MEGHLEVPVTLAPNYFFITNPAVVVTGPISDGTLQVDFADDHIVYPTMRVTGDMVGTQPSDGLANPRFEFPTTLPARTILGRMKMAPAAARQLAALLITHADAADQAMAAHAAATENQNQA